jgi:tight adherence protein B
MLITILISVPILMGIVLIIIGFFERQQDATELANMSKRLNQVATRSTAGGFAATDAKTQEVDKEFARQEEKRLRAQRKTTYLPSLSKLSEGSTFLTRLDDELMQVRSHWRATEVMAASVLLALVILVVFLLLGASYFSFLFVIPVIFLPRIYIKALRTMYFRRFDDQLGDALMLMSNSLRAGFSFMQALEMIGREAPAPISEEFARVTQEIQVGVPIPEALNAMSQRIDSMDLRLVVTAVIIQREVGGALAQLLELIAGVIRERQRIKGEIRTLTAQGRLTGFILGMMPITVGFLIYLVSRAANGPNEPTFIDPLINTTMGQMLLAFAFVWQIIGFWLIMRIVSIKV